MTEQKIEKIIMDKVEAALKNVGLDNVQVIGAW